MQVSFLQEVTGSSHESSHRAPAEGVWCWKGFPFLDPRLVSRALGGGSLLPAANTGRLAAPRDDLCRPRSDHDLVFSLPREQSLLQVAPVHGIYARQPDAGDSSNHSVEASKDMVPPLNTSWSWLQAYSAPWIPGFWGKCTQLTDGAKPRKRPLRQDRLLLLHTTGQSLHTGALKEAGFFWAAFVKETLLASQHSSPRMRKQPETLWPSELLVPCVLWDAPHGMAHASSPRTFPGLPGALTSYRDH